LPFIGPILRFFAPLANPFANIYEIWQGDGDCPVFSAKIFQVALAPKPEVGSKKNLGCNNLDQALYVHAMFSGVQLTPGDVNSNAICLFVTLYVCYRWECRVLWFVTLHGACVSM